MSPHRNSMLAAASQYITWGFTLFVAPPGTKKSYKAARFADGRKWGATNILAEITADLRRRPHANLAVVTGPESNVFILDVDSADGHGREGFQSLKVLEAQHGKLPRTLRARTPTGGGHVYFKYPSGIDIRNSTSHLAPGIDIRGRGGMCLLPPSVKPGVGVYSWLNKYKIAEAPDWLMERCVSIRTTKTHNQDHVPSGTHQARQSRHLEGS
jgi:hypothetical protein